MYRIGELSKLCEIKVPTIRYFENIGLLDNPSRTDGNQRLYSEKDFKHLRFIKRGRELGFTQSELKILLGLNNKTSPNCEEVYKLTKNHLRVVKEKIKDLKKIEETLLHLSTRCKNGDDLDCPILDSLYSEMEL